VSELTEAVEAARQAFAAATNLEELAVARREHLGDDAPISQARRALGSLPKNERKDAGRLVNQARGEAEKAYATAKTALEEKRNAEVLIAERVDVTVPTTRRQGGALLGGVVGLGPVSPGRRGGMGTPTVRPVGCR